jgi:hypothetical protein
MREFFLIFTKGLNTILDKSKHQDAFGLTLDPIELRLLRIVLMKK